MSWAQRRKTTYIASALLIFAVILAVVVFSMFSKTPTCFDGIQNQNETGIDCGGSCNILCRAGYSNPVVVWGPRWAKVYSNGSYNFLTYAQNPNVGVGADAVKYLFKVYDKDGILLYQKSYETYVPANNNFVIFEDNINLNDKVPARTKFEFLGPIAWEKMNDAESVVITLSKNLMNEDTRPKLVATIKNTTLKTVENIESVAILYDENNNAAAFSKTKTDSLIKDGTADIVFTWPEKFISKIVRIDIISKVLSK